MIPVKEKRHQWNFLGFKAHAIGKFQRDGKRVAVDETPWNWLSHPQ